MDKQQAIRIVNETLQNPFDRERYRRFIKELLNHIDEEGARNNQGNLVPKAYQEYVSRLERIGKYVSNGKEIMLFIVYLKKETSIERARSMQRNFIAGYLSGKYGGTPKDAALVAFVSPNQADWRFSLIKMEYSIGQTAKGKPKIVEEFTPARRWSFLVGPNEKSHTAQSRLVPLMMDDVNSPSLEELEEAFNIEKVTNEFFIEYRNLFIRTKEELDRAVAANPRAKSEFENKGINTVDFAKKLLGQIVFLYFLQKKGWFGVPRSGEWGSGSKNFLRELFAKKHGDYGNFFNDILEPLFYEALRTNRQHDDHYYSRFNCKIPFLNGGLFDPIGNYDWVNIDIFLPDELFSNTRKTKEGDIGDGILDIFDRYNFTVREDEPYEKEVAIDPELLGKAYEKFNAIRPDNFNEYLQALDSGKKGEENKFNKQYGVYYTPREIVHYMCRQSLINYLYTELNPEPIVSELGSNQGQLFSNEDLSGQLRLSEASKEVSIAREDIEALIYHGERVGEHEAQVISQGRETGRYSHRLPESIRIHAEVIDEKLAQIRVCDPAVGSGAFPVGMMGEIVRARLLLETFLKKGKTLYDFKRECIENSLYGVDIDPGAVEIAKLRLWLSLIVDEDDIQNIKPLPNLDYKIVCGNSLVGFPDNLSSPIEKEIEGLIHEYFNETNPTKKSEIKVKIDEKIETRYTNALIAFGYKVNFDFKTVFSEVFRQRDGFDVVIGNPPYINSGKIKDIKLDLKRVYGNFYDGTADLYTYFIKKGLDVTRTNGCLCYITSNKYMRAGYGKNTRELLTKNATPFIIIDFGELPVFEAATDPSIIIVTKSPQKDSFLTAITIKSEEEIACVSEVIKKRSFSMPVSALSTQGWILEDQSVLQLKEKLKKVGVPLNEFIKGDIYRGILTGFNKAFIIDEDTKNRLIKEDSKCKELIKPWLDGNEIMKWTSAWSHQYLIKIESSANINWPWSAAKEEEALLIFQQQYPSVYTHLIKFMENLKAREDKGTFWWELRSCTYYDVFEKPKLLYNETSKELHAFIDYEGFYINKTGFVIQSNELEYLLGIMNSRLMDWYYRVDFPTYGDPWKGGRIQFRKDPNMLGVPIVQTIDELKAPIIKIVQEILSITRSPDFLHSSTQQAQVKELELQIDRLVYDLYGLTEDEIGIVERVNN